MAHCNERGAEVIVGDKSHFNLWEQGGICQVKNQHVLKNSDVFD
jgi:threonine aldolase